MMYLGDKAVGINHFDKIDWDAVASGEQPAFDEIILSDFITTIANDSFSGLPITSLTGLGVTTINVSAFFNCNKLKSINMPNLQSIQASSFRNSGIEYIIAPKLNSIGSDAIYAMNSLKGLDIGNTTIENFLGNGYVFDHKSTCITILRYNFVLEAKSGWFYQGCWLKNTTTPGILYVWQNLIEDYQNHEIWGPLLAQNNNQILPIEGSIYETHYCDGTLIV